MKKPAELVQPEEAKPEEVEPEETEEVEPEETEEVEETEPEAKPEIPESPKQEQPEWQSRLSKVEDDINELKQAARRKVRHSKPPKSEPESKATPQNLKPKLQTIKSKRFLGRLFKSKNPSAKA